MQIPFWINLIVGIVSFLTAALSGKKLIPFLMRLKAGATILEIGPRWHKDKAGTPIMGGIMFIVSTVIASWLGYGLLSVVNSGSDIDMGLQGLKLLTGMTMALMFMLVGFFDDYIKVVKKRNLGLTAKQKIVLQVLISGAYLFVLYVLGDTSTKIVFPFIGSINFGVFYYPLMILFIIFMVNSVNLSDGIDGLCGTMTTVYALSFAVIFLLVGNGVYSSFSIALACGCLGFLVWNLHPARVFMGDTGSMFLGGCVVALGFASGFHFLIPLMGIVYVIESLSVILQVISYKTTGKRIFKMSPIHHHFELCKWGEYKIVVVFSAVTLIGCLLGIWWTAGMTLHK